MRATVALLCGLAAALCLVSCRQEAYEAGEGELSLLTAEFGELLTDADTVACSAVTDADRRLRLQQGLRARWMTTPDSSFRALIYYFVNRHDTTAAVRTYSVQPVPVLMPLARRHFTDGTVRDPVVMESVWQSANGRWLNMSFFVRTGESGDDQARHVLGLVRDTLTRWPPTDGTDSLSTLCLSLHHEQNGVPEYYSQRAYLSVPMSALEQADSVRLSVTTYQGDVSYCFAIRKQD